MIFSLTSDISVQHCKCTALSEVSSLPKNWFNVACLASGSPMLKVRSSVIFISQVEHTLWHILDRTGRLDRQIMPMQHAKTKSPNPYRLWCEVEISQCIKFNKQRLHHRLDLNVLRVFLFFFCTFLPQQTLTAHTLPCNNSSNCKNRRLSLINDTWTVE